MGDVFMKIVIVRHGDPDYEKDSLTEKGFREAEMLVPRLSKLDVKAFYCSPLGRAQDTAKPTLEAMGRRAETLKWLREFRGVVRNGLNFEGCWDRMPSYWCKEAKYYDSAEWQNTSLMKSANVRREYKYVCKHLDELLEKHGYRHEGRLFKVLNSNHNTIVLFCHFGVEAVMLSHILSVSPMPFWHNFVALPTSVTTLITEERERGIASFRIQQFGDISHLYAAGEEPAFAARFCECYNDDTRH